LRSNNGIYVPFLGFTLARLSSPVCLHGLHQDGHDRQEVEQGEVGQETPVVADEVRHDSTSSSSYHSVPVSSKLSTAIGKCGESPGAASRSNWRERGRAIRGQDGPEVVSQAGRLCGAFTAFFLVWRFWGEPDNPPGPSAGKGRGSPTSGRTAPSCFRRDIYHTTWDPEGSRSRRWVTPPIIGGITAGGVVPGHR
jgi:hypothetical protein